MKFNFFNNDFRAFVIDGEAWFSGLDVANILGYEKTNLSSVIKRNTYTDDRKDVSYKGAPDFLKELWTGADKMPKILISESGLYCMIFMSRKPEAEDFKKWVTREVLPRIRQNGGYIQGEEKLSRREQEKLSKEVRKLSGKVEKLQEEKKTARKKWHKAVAARDALKEEKKEYKAKITKISANYSKLQQEADDNLELYFKVLDELGEAEEKIISIRKTVNNAVTTTVRQSKPTAKPSARVVGFKYKEESRPDRTITVDKEGRIII